MVKTKRKIPHFSTVFLKFREKQIFFVVGVNKLYKSLEDATCIKVLNTKKIEQYGIKKTKIGLQLNKMICWHQKAHACELN